MPQTSNLNINNPCRRSFSSTLVRLERILLVKVCMKNICLEEFNVAGMLIHTPRFSKYLHGAAGLYPDVIERLPYWFLHNSDGTFSPATWDEMAAEEETGAEKVQLIQYCAYRIVELVLLLYKIQTVVVQRTNCTLDANCINCTIVAKS